MHGVHTKRHPIGMAFLVGHSSVPLSLCGYDVLPHAARHLRLGLLFVSRGLYDAHAVERPPHEEERHQEERRRQHVRECGAASSTASNQELQRTLGFLAWDCRGGRRKCARLDTEDDRATFFTLKCVYDCCRYQTGNRKPH